MPRQASSTHRLRRRAGASDAALAHSLRAELRWRHDDVRRRWLQRWNAAAARRGGVAIGLTMPDRVTHSIGR
jgi:hypothetical protein